MTIAMKTKATTLSTMLPISPILTARVCDGDGKWISKSVRGMMRYFWTRNDGESGDY